MAACRSKVAKNWSKFVGGGGLTRYKLLARRHRYEGWVHSMLVPAARNKQHKSIDHLQLCTVKLKEKVHGIHVVLAGHKSSYGAQHFLYDHLPQLRFNNPNIRYGVHEKQPKSKIRVYLSKPETAENPYWVLRKEPPYPWKQPPPDDGEWVDVETQGLMPHEIMGKVCSLFGESGNPGTCTSRFKWSDETPSPVEVEKEQKKIVSTARRARKKARKEKLAAERQRQETVDAVKGVTDDELIDLSELVEDNEELSGVWTPVETVQQKERPLRRKQAKLLEKKEKRKLKAKRLGEKKGKK